jgi:hypothetical protein
VAGAPIIHSEFDSGIFGVPFYRVLDAGAAGLAEALDALSGGAVIADAKLPASDLAAAARLSALGFQKASTLIEFGGAPAGGQVPDPDLRHELSLSHEDLASHAQGFRFQRFRQDARIPEARSVTLMERWIDNSLGGRRETVAIGRNFCTFAVSGERLTVDLLSCLDTGQGVAGRLLAALHGIAGARGCRDIRVATEAENLAALRTYLRAGLLPVETWAALHLVRHDD